MKEPEPVSLRVVLWFFIVVILVGVVMWVLRDSLAIEALMRGME